MIAIGSALFIFIRSYLRVNDALLTFVQKYRVDPSQFEETQTWVIVLLLSVLVAVTLFGVALIFIYYQKLFKLYRFQQNFINGFTHELKTPIASLRLYLDTFKRYELDRDEQMKYINYMVRDTERLTLNVNQILHIAKIEDKSFSPSFRRTNIIQFLKNFLEKNPHYFEEMEISYDTDNEIATELEIEPELFEMVIMNIVTNAIIYSNNSKPKLNISWDLDDKFLSVHFKDNGIGIDKSEFKNIFKKMYQIGKTTKGSGLGLYLSTSIMRIHKGKLEIASEGLGKGSTFTVRLPLKGR